MADRDDLELTYSLLDRIVRLSLGELADFSGAKYDGDFSLTSRRPSGASATTSPSRSASVRADALLDLGCGWGAQLQYVRERGGTGVGITLLSAQAAACRRHRLEVHF